MKMESSWRFDTPGPMPREAVLAFDSLLGKVVGQGSRWSMLEHFKGYFEGTDRSSSESCSSFSMQKHAMRAKSSHMQLDTPESRSTVLALRDQSTFSHNKGRRQDRAITATAANSGRRHKR
ncbi:hypothetical protein [Mesorhizobium sp.]|uniref:hypothetical protein n=1 Tax=Mesorhizobium sp. TaxID=1871066 RepID=UPI000FE544A2|nr:hypothetical protein [Mesorhizobium sp.]RWO26483.1 MAG: hypothetical protein EOS09_07845 [Mesorhizobium sp.]